VTWFFIVFWLKQKDDYAIYQSYLLHASLPHAGEDTSLCKGSNILTKPMIDDMKNLIEFYLHGPLHYPIHDYHATQKDIDNFQILTI